MRSMSQLVTALVFISGIVACDAEHLDSDGAEFRGKVKNAPNFNSANLNGLTLNGLTLNGLTLNGLTLNGLTLNGLTLNGLTLNGSRFEGVVLVNGIPQVVGGADLVGTSMTISSATSIYVLTFDAIYPDPANPAGDVYLHEITVHDITAGTSSPLCEHNGAAAPAIPIRNRWDPVTGDRIDDTAAVTFACRGGALAKCIDWGYRPWASSTRCEGDDCGTVSLADYHQACTRMVRADYCGDGVPYTVDGTLIDVYDPLAPRIQTRTSTGLVNWGIEAEWGPDGVVCIGDALRLDHLDELGIPYDPPACLADLDVPDCGSFAPERGGLVADAYCYAWGSDPKSCDLTPP
jgi:hypothetical protein